MLIMFLVVMGFFSFQQLGVDLFPKSDPATCYVRVQLPGASPEEVVSQVILPLEESIAAVSGIDELRAVVSEGSGNIIVTFVLERDISEATEDVREKVSAAMRKLPPNVLPPTVAKADPDNDPVITLAVSGQRSVRELTEIADKQVRRAIETADGVAAVDMSGAQQRQINIMMDLNKLSAYNLTPQDVQKALVSENIEAPGGRIVRGPTELGVRTLGRLDNVREFGGIIIKNVKGAPIRIHDIGYAEDATAERRTFAYFHGKPAVVLDVRRQIGTNTVKVVEGVQEKLAALNQILPPGVKIEVLKEQATYIKNSVEALEEHLVLGSLLASVIVWLFIRNWRTVLISSIAIPTSIITTFTLMRMMDFTLNSMTLLGLTLAVGIVIDDAIIVLENIYRFIDERGMEPIPAAIAATKEIALAVIATTISLVIIFVPIAFMTGYAKRYLNQFGWTMAFSIMVSMLVAFTLTPSLSSRILKRRTNGNGKPHEHQPTFLDRGYVKTLDWALNQRWAIIAICVLVFCSTFVINGHIGRDWMPEEDQDQLAINLEVPEGSSLAATEKTATDIARRVEQIDGVIAVLPQTNTGFMDRVNMANITVLLKPRDERADISTMGQKVRAILRDYMFARPRVTFPNVLGGRDTFAPIRAQLLGPDMKSLVEYAKQANIALAKEPSIADIKANLNLNNPEFQVNIDRPLASDLGRARVRYRGRRPPAHVGRR